VTLLIPLPVESSKQDSVAAPPSVPRPDPGSVPEPVPEVGPEQDCLATIGSPVDAAFVAGLEARCADGWRAERRGVIIDLPSSAREIVESLWAQLAYILINRDGPAIQPGSRSYDRSWIRDGALTSKALLTLGHPEVVRDFLLWFASHQYADGKVPCCIDERGADPVPEHDSHGEFIYLAAEYYRYTGDVPTALSVWPAVARASAYIDTLRRQRLTRSGAGRGWSDSTASCLPPSATRGTRPSRCTPIGMTSGRCAG